MEKSKIQEALERVYSKPESDWLNPDNHDKVHIALGLFEAETAAKDRQTLEDLRGQIKDTAHVLSSTMEIQVKRLINSNERLSASNEGYAKWMKWLTVALVFTGIAQVIIT